MAEPSRFEMAARPDLSSEDLKDGFLDHILRAAFPCPVAQSTAKRGCVHVETFGTMAQDAERVHAAVADWLTTSEGQTMRSFVALFAQEAHSDLQSFHAALWGCLGTMRSLEATPSAPEPGVSDDIASPHFAFRIHNHPFFVVGLSPHSPRLSRQTPVTGFALNPHSQFERLRAQGLMDGVKRTSRARDIALQGSINPLLSDHGDSSPALQYSSMPVADVSACPYSKG